MNDIEQVIEEVKVKAKENFIPIVRDKTLQELLKLVKEKQPKTILEIGTATGYSALNMLNVCDGKIIGVEKNDDRADEAQENFKKAGVKERIVVVTYDALNVLQDLVQCKEKFDFIFLDGPKGQYIRYFPLIKQILNIEGILFADNVGVLGLVDDKTKVTHKNRTMVRNMQTFLDTLQADEDFETTIYHIDDGYAVSILKK